MIVTVGNKGASDSPTKEDVNMAGNGQGSSGYKLNMMSRTGKSTSNMYMAFQKKRKPLAQAPADNESQVSLNDISETSSENDSEDEKNALQLRNNKLKLTIDTEMRKIEEQMKVQQMSRTKKIKKELQKKFGKEGKVTEQDITKQMMEINRRNLTANFQTTSRDQH